MKYEKYFKKAIDLYGYDEESALIYALTQWEYLGNKPKTFNKKKCLEEIHKYIEQKRG